MSKRALIIIDMQKAFFEGTEKLPKLPKEKGEDIIQKIGDLRERARKSGIPVIYTFDSFSPEEAPIEPHFKIFGVHGIEGQEGTKIVEKLKPEKGDFVVGKLRYDAFHGTRLDLILRELEVNTLIFTGIWLDACVQHTIMGGFFRCYDTILVEDCTATPFEDEGQRSLEYIKKFYATKITTLDEISREL